MTFVFPIGWTLEGSGREVLEEVKTTENAGDFGA